MRWLRRKNSRVQSTLPRIRLTTVLGLIVVFLTSLGLLWVLGVVAHQDQSSINQPHTVNVIPSCSLESKLWAEFDILSFDKALFEISFDFPEQPVVEGKTLRVSTTHQMTLGFALANYEDNSASNEREIKPSSPLTVIRNNLTHDRLKTEFIVSLETEEPVNSVILQFIIADPVFVRSLAEGEVQSSFIFPNLSADDADLPFIVILHRDIRMTARDLGASLDDPGNPNVYRYITEPSSNRSEAAGVFSRFVIAKFAIQIPERERLKETLLIILSALFGVGISALFESLLASEIYAALAAGLFRSNGKPQDYQIGSKGPRGEQKARSTS